MDIGGDVERRETGLVLQANDMSEGDNSTFSQNKQVSEVSDQNKQESEAGGKIDNRQNGRRLVDTHSDGSSVPTVKLEDQSADSEIDKFIDRKTLGSSCVDQVTDTCDQVKDNLDQDSPPLVDDRRLDMVENHVRPPIGVDVKLSSSTQQTQYRPPSRPVQSRQSHQVQIKSSNSISSSSSSKSSDHAIQVLFYHQSLRFPPPYQK